MVTGNIPLVAEHLLLIPKTCQVRQQTHAPPTYRSNPGRPVNSIPQEHFKRTVKIPEKNRKCFSSELLFRGLTTNFTPYKRYRWCLLVSWRFPFSLRVVCNESYFSCYYAFSCNIFGDPRCMDSLYARWTSIQVMNADLLTLRPSGQSCIGYIRSL
jgi:hypothetical protein